MNATTTAPSALLSIDPTQLSQIIDVCYEKMLDDYRVNRFFNSRPANEQTGPLKLFVLAVVSGGKPEQRLALLDDYFTAAFARSNAKPSLVTGSDFGFLLDIIGGQDIQVITPLCLAHNHLLKLQPNDDIYDVFIAHLQETLQQLNIAADASKHWLTLAESGREGFLGRLPEA